MFRIWQYAWCATNMPKMTKKETKFDAMRVAIQYSLLFFAYFSCGFEILRMRAQKQLFNILAGPGSDKILKFASRYILKLIILGCKTVETSC